jgi:hypothetical protein
MPLKDVSNINGNQYITSIVHAITDKNDPNLRNYDNPDGRVWSIYSAESRKDDIALVESWKGDMDGTLIFVSFHNVLCRYRSPTSSFVRRASSLPVSQHLLLKVKSC